MPERTYQQHVQNFGTILNDIREAREQDCYDDTDPLCIDTHILKRVWLTFGGPNIFIDFELNEHGTEVYKAEYCYRWGSNRHEYLLSDDEADELAEFYGLLQY